MSFLDIYRVPDYVAIQSEDGWSGMEKAGQTWSWNRVEMIIKEQDKQLCFHLRSGPVPVKRIAVKWRVNIEPGVRLLGDHWERGYGDLEWRGIVPERVMPWYFLINNGRATHGYGVKTGPSSMCFWQVSEKDITLCMDVRCGGSGVVLGDRELCAAVLVSREGIENELPFQAAKEFCKLMCDKPLMPSQPVYGGNNWYYAYGKSSHDEILKDSKMMAELSSSTENRPFMVIDDGWQICHSKSCNGGPWHSGNYLFPDMAKLALQMKEEGVKPGLWVRPLMTSEMIPEHWRLPNCRFKNAEHDQFMDPSIPEVLEFVSRDIKRSVSWGYELIKHDFSTFDLLGRWGFEMNGELTNDSWHFSDRSKTTAEIIGDLYRTIRKAAGSALVLGCNTVAHIAAGNFELQRTGDDTSGRQWERTRKMGINTLAFRMSQHEAFFAADADCAGITENIPWALNEQWLRLLSQSGTPLFVSVSPDTIRPEQKNAVKAAFEAAARIQPAGEPLDWMDTTCPGKWRLNGEIAGFDWYENDRIEFCK